MTRMNSTDPVPQAHLDGETLIIEGEEISVEHC
jgi:hypothetical protein